MHVRRSRKNVSASAARRCRGIYSLELMMVFLSILLLVYVALPRYQRARSVALISTIVSELIGTAQACALLNSGGYGDKPVPRAATAERGGVTILKGCTGEQQGATLQASWGMARAEGIACFGSRSTLNSTRATILIQKDNNLSCSFE